MRRAFRTLRGPLPASRGLLPGTVPRPEGTRRRPCGRECPSQRFVRVGTDDFSDGCADMGLRVSICHGIRAFLLAAGRACRCIFAVRHALPAFWRRNVRFGEGPSAGIPDGTRRMRPEAGRNEAGGIVAGLRTPEACRSAIRGGRRSPLKKHRCYELPEKRIFILGISPCGGFGRSGRRPRCPPAGADLQLRGGAARHGGPASVAGLADRHRKTRVFAGSLSGAGRFGPKAAGGGPRRYMGLRRRAGGAEPACEIRGRSAAALLRLLLEGEGVGHGRRRIGLESGGIVADRAVRRVRLEGGVGVLPFRRGAAAPQVQVEPADRAGELVHGGQCRRIYAPAGGAALAGPQGDGFHLRTGLLRTLYQRPQGRRPGPGPAVHRLRQAGGVCGLRRYGPAGGGEQCRGHRAGQRLVQLADAGCLRHARRELAHAAEGEAEHRRRVRIGCARGDRHRPHVAVGPRRDRLQQRPVGRDDRPHPDRARLERGRIPRQPVAAGLPGSRSVGPSDGGPDAADARDRGVAGGTGRTDLSRGLSGGFRREPHRLGRGAGAGRAGTDRRVAVQRGAEGRRLAGYAEQHVAHPRALSDRTADSRRGGHGDVRTPFYLSRIPLHAGAGADLRAVSGGFHGQMRPYGPAVGRDVPLLHAEAERAERGGSADAIELHSRHSRRGTHAGEDGLDARRGGGHGVLPLQFRCAERL